METCHNCGKERENLSRHWHLSSECEYPKLTEQQKEIISGMLMGDGSLNFWNKDRNCRLEVKMVKQEFLDHLDNELGIFSNGVRLQSTGAEQASKSKEAFGVEAEPDNYNDVYRFQTKSIPELNEFADWYTDDGKVWPEENILTPTVLKYWYASDGTLDNSAHHEHILISCVSERDNKQKVERYFEKADLPTPSRWNESERKTGGWRSSIAFTKSDSRKLFEYMGEPLPGFEYKWPKDLRDSQPNTVV